MSKKILFLATLLTHGPEFSQSVQMMASDEPEESLAQGSISDLTQQFKENTDQPQEKKNDWPAYLHKRTETK